MTTNTPSQAASIDTPEFRMLTRACLNSTAGDYRHNRDTLIAHIDAKLAQAHLEKQVAEAAAEVEARDRDEWKARATAAESRAEKAEQYAQVALGIKDSLEARIAEIQRGVEGLQGYDKARILVVYADVLALLQPQGQADTSEQVHNAGTWQSSNFKVVDRKIQGRISVGDGGGKEMYYLDPLGTDADDDGPIIDTSGLLG